MYVLYTFGLCVRISVLTEINDHTWSQVSDTSAHSCELCFEFLLCLLIFCILLTHLKALWPTLFFLTIFSINKDGLEFAHKMYSCTHLLQVASRRIVSILLISSSMCGFPLFFHASSRTEPVSCTFKTIAYLFDKTQNCAEICSWLYQIRNLQQFDSADEICINRMVEQTVHQIVQSRQEDIRSIWRPLPTLNLRTHKQTDFNEDIWRNAGNLVNQIAEVAFKDQ